MKINFQLSIINFQSIINDLIFKLEILKIQ